MKRMFAKWWLWVSLTLILCLMTVFCATMDETAPLSFLLESPSQSRALNIYDGEDGNYYVFLPSYARLEDLKIELTGGEAVFLGDTKLTDGMDCGSFSPGTGYPLRVNNQQMAESSRAASRTCTRVILIRLADMIRAIDRLMTIEAMPTSVMAQLYRSMTTR